MRGRPGFVRPPTCVSLELAGLQIDKLNVMLENMTVTWGGSGHIMVPVDDFGELTRSCGAWPSCTTSRARTRPRELERVDMFDWPEFRATPSAFDRLPRMSHRGRSGHRRSVAATSGHERRPSRVARNTTVAPKSPSARGQDLRALRGHIRRSSDSRRPSHLRDRIQSWTTVFVSGGRRSTRLFVRLPTDELVTACLEFGGRVREVVLDAARDGRR